MDDPPVHPNCECSVDYVTDLTKVPDDSDGESQAARSAPDGYTVHCCSEGRAHQTQRSRVMAKKKKGPKNKSKGM
jgi:hypothetical protein